MARVQFGFGINSINGKVGGSVFARGNYGNVLRSTPKHTAQKSALQMQHRAEFNSVLQLWSTISEENRNEWNSYAEYYNSFPERGGTTRLTGYTVFCQVNNNLLLIERPLISQPVWKPFTCPVTYIESNVNASNVIYGYGPTPFEDDPVPAAFITSPLSNGISNGMPYALYIPIYEITVNTLVFTPNYFKKFSTLPIPGFSIFIYISFIDVYSGLRSSELSVKSLIPITIS